MVVGGDGKLVVGGVWDGRWFMGWSVGEMVGEVVVGGCGWLREQFCFLILFPMTHV